MAAWCALRDTRSDIVTPEPGAADTGGPGEVPEGDVEIRCTALCDRRVRLARLTGADTVSVEEIVQDAFAQLYRCWRRVRGPAADRRIAVVGGCRCRRRGLQGRPR
jgi:hypothetical protein